MGVRKVISKQVAKRYQESGKREKGKILDKLERTLGMNSPVLSFLLRNTGKRGRNNLCVYNKFT